MPNAERIAELQRVAYGAGATDVERAAAAGELEALRGGDVPAVDSRAGSSSAGPPTETTMPARGTDVFDAPEAPEESPAEEPHRPVSQAVRWSVLAGAIALAVGFSAGWALGAQTASQLDASPDGTDVASIAFPLETAEPDLPVGATTAYRMFERPPTEQDLAADPMLFSHVEVVPESPRLLATSGDGVRVYAALTTDHEMCVGLRIDEFSSGGGCTQDGMFPAAGLGVETYVEGQGFHAAWLDANGQVRLSVDAG